MKAVEAGTFRKRIQIAAPKAGLDDYGQPILAPDGWEVVAVRWAEVRPISGRERLESAQVQAEISHKVRLRPVVGLALSAKNRIVFDGGRTLEVVVVRDLEERGLLLELDCLEGVAIELPGAAP